MEFLKKKKKILYAGCVFFVIMFFCWDRIIWNRGLL